MPPPEPSEFPFDLLDPPRALPELRFVDGEGRPLTLADFRGKVILLNIWATWCIPCLREMPTLDRLQAKLGGPRFEVVVLSIDIGGVGVVKKFYRALRLEALGIYVDKTTRARTALGITGIPTTLLIDRQGREIGRFAGPAEWDSQEAIKTIRRYLE
ncbi:MAG: TlpA family protein disulfide reductase [Proteobacteria bacterium]|nr:TlpA family protein disulfide reductase [Pseudomonadota bacterium]